MGVSLVILLTVLVYFCFQTLPALKFWLSLWDAYSSWCLQLAEVSAVSGQLHLQPLISLDLFLHITVCSYV